MTTPSFRLLVVDHDQKSFAITEWMRDDTEMTERVAAEQQRRLTQKRKLVNCQSIPEEYATDAAIITEAQRLNPGYTYSSNPLV